MRGVLMLALLALAGSALAQPMRSVPLADDGWWVVLGSFDNNGGSGSRAADVAVARMRRQAQSCGERPFNDVSEKFRGLRRASTSRCSARIRHGHVPRRPGPE
ncbi:protein of unknown function; putative exported protein [Methylorubrum extorquens DM4]|uniref:Uncharacterized protein n=1 Tax=Methylorubrum extorquens (strain DSM 6343 / CIP 106787 / DM4) TaxID=661410 RepID=C7CFR9_METED|nr:protein of unknown function; putative exported protein [Methylorubrum extorquens DM4]